jgi:hypothetical protein
MPLTYVTYLDDSANLLSLFRVLGKYSDLILPELIGNSYNLTWRNKSKFCHYTWHPLTNLLVHMLINFLTITICTWTFLSYTCTSHKIFWRTLLFTSPSLTFHCIFHTFNCYILLNNNNTCFISFTLRNLINLGIRILGMNICISFLKKTFRNDTDNSTTEPQGAFLCFEKKFESRPKLANDELVRTS